MLVSFDSVLFLYSVRALRYIVPRLSPIPDIAQRR